MEEMWKTVDGYENYEASTLGRVRSKLRDCRVLKPGLSMRGYKIVVLRRDGKSVTKTLHRLILSTFVPNLHNLATVNHINGIKTDNRLENLEWCSQIDNMAHARRIGLYGPRLSMNSKGKRPYKPREKRTHPNAKEVIQFKDGIEVGRYPSTMAASKVIGACDRGVANACRGLLKTLKGFEFKYANI